MLQILVENLPNRAEDYIIFLYMINQPQRAKACKSNTELMILFLVYYHAEVLRSTFSVTTYRLKK